MTSRRADAAKQLVQFVKVTFLLTQQGACQRPRASFRALLIRNVRLSDIASEIRPDTGQGPERTLFIVGALQASQELGRDRTPL